MTINKLVKSILIIFAGVVIFSFGLFTSWIYILSHLAGSPDPSGEIWSSVILFSIFFFLASGVALFSFKEWARKLALFSYALALADNLVYCLGTTYSLIIARHQGVVPSFYLYCFISTIVCIFFICILCLFRREFKENENPEPYEVEAARIYKKIFVGILVFFSFLYFVYFVNLFKEAKNVERNKKDAELLEPKIKNDKRFEKVSLYSGSVGPLGIAGIVRSEEDYIVLQDVVKDSKIPVFWILNIDDPEILAQKDESYIYANIGYMAKKYNDDVSRFLRQNETLFQIGFPKFQINGIDAIGIYVKADEKERVVNLFKNDPYLSDKFSIRPVSQDFVKDGADTLVSAGFIIISRKDEAADILNKDNIRNLLRVPNFPGYGYYACYIYVLPQDKEKAVELLKNKYIKSEYYAK